MQTANPSTSVSLVRCNLAFAIAWAIALALQVSGGGYALGQAAQSLGEKVAENAQLAFFETKVRPLLEKHCLECHSGDAPKGDLSLDSARGWRSAGVIEPQRSQGSRLYEVVLSEDSDERMPPPPAMGLSDREKDVLRAWIDSGAFDPREGKEGDSGEMPAGPKKRPRVFEITDTDLSHWAFQPLRRLDSDDPALREIRLSQSPSDIIDALLKTKGDLAAPRTRLRRLFYDLWGLPPTYAQVQAFEQDSSEVKWNRMVDELLESRSYAERWGQYWLDWVRYAETNGYERDGVKPNAWRYRDYVIDAFERDKPYDRFLLEQLAGDLLIKEQGLSVESHEQQWRESMVATGFFRLHVWDDEPDDTLVAEYDDADDVMVSIGSAMMGLTIGCARCHDHKFDPISQRDYYSMLAYFRQIEPYGLSKKGGGGRGTGRIQRSLVPEAQTRAWEEDRQRAIAETQKTLDAASDPAIRLDLDGKIRQLRDKVAPFDSALSVWEVEGPQRETFVLHRGDPNSPREAVTAAIPEVLVRTARSENSGIGGGDAGGGRLAFAKWMVDAKNPLTARVIVNRVWQRHFGEGIVPSIDDFGATGLPPQNLPLLDYLASELIRSGWSLKHLHRIILRTQAYQLSIPDSKSNRDDSDAAIVSESIAMHSSKELRRYESPQLRRLDAEAIRDSILFVSGKLGGKRSGPSVYPTLTQEVRDTANPVSVALWQDSPKEEQNCRSIYLVAKRSLRVPFLEVLDYPGGTAPTVVRSVTTTAPQSLLLLNDPWMTEQAAALNERIHKLVGRDDVEARIDQLWYLVYQRKPDEFERAEAIAYLKNAPDGAGRWVSLCRVLLNSSEFLYMD